MDIDEDVVAARCAATRVAVALKKAKALKDETMQITADDDWGIYEKAKRFCERAEQVVVEAETAYKEASCRWHAVQEATKARRLDDAIALPRDAADRAYRQANKDVNNTSRLINEVKQNCKDACEQLRRH